MPHTTKHHSYHTTKQMTQPNDPDSGTLAVSNANHDRDDRQVVRTSIRVLLDSNATPTCDDCGATISQGTQFKCVTVRERNGVVVDLAFCDDRCRSRGL